MRRARTVGDMSNRRMTPPVSERVVRARRLEYALIAAGGLFLIFGWGIGHQEWARGAGWILTGIGFAFEMIYGRNARSPRQVPGQSSGQSSEPASEPASGTETSVSDEATSEAEPKHT
jgi:hypothetical protein